MRYYAILCGRTPADQKQKNRPGVLFHPLGVFAAAKIINFIFKNALFMRFFDIKKDPILKNNRLKNGRTPADQSRTGADEPQDIEK